MVQSTLYGNQTPGGSFNDATAYTMGTRFTANVAGFATHGRWYFPGTLPGGTVSCGIYRNVDSQLLGSATFSAPVAGAWNTAAFDPPIALDAGEPYTAVIWTPDRYVSTSAYAWPTGAGNVVSASADAGRYATSGSPFTFPTNSVGGAYFADLVFETDLATTITPDGIAVPVALGEPTLTMLIEQDIAPAGIAVPVALGEPTLTFVAQTETGGSWETLLGIVREAEADHERNAARMADPVECPEHGWPLDTGPDGTKHCLFGGHVV